MKSLGTRHNKADTTTDQFTLGLRGPIMESELGVGPQRRLLSH